MKYTLDPWVIRFEQAITQALIPAHGKESVFIKFNLEGLLRGDYVSRMNGYAVEDGGDLYLVNGNMLPLAMAGAYAAQEATGGEDTSPESMRSSRR